MDKRSPTVIMEPNNDYWNPTRIPKVRIKFDNIISKAEAIDEVIKGGKIDIVTELTPAEAMKVSESSKAGVVESRAKTVLVGVFNQNKSGSKWKNKELRQAINHAVDKKLVLQEGHLGYGTIMPAMITGGSFGYNSSLSPYAYEPKKAQAVLKEAGIKDFVIATGKQISVREFVRLSAKHLGISIEFSEEGVNEIGTISAIDGDDAASLKVGDVIVKVDPRYFRPTEVETLLGDPTKAKDKLGWVPEITLEEMCAEMVKSDLDIAKRQALLKFHGHNINLPTEY